MVGGNFESHGFQSGLKKKSPLKEKIQDDGKN